MHRTRLRQGWPGDGDPDQRLLGIAEAFGAARDLVATHATLRAGVQSLEQARDVQAARTRIMHALYVSAHSVSVAVREHIRDLQQVPRVEQQSTRATRGIPTRAGRAGPPHRVRRTRRQLPRRAPRPLPRGGTSGGVRRAGPARRRHRPVGPAGPPDTGRGGDAGEPVRDRADPGHDQPDRPDPGARRSAHRCGGPSDLRAADRPDVRAGHPGAEPPGRPVGIAHQPHDTQGRPEPRVGGRAAARRPRAS